MQKLVRGYQRFRAEVFPKTQRLFEGLKGQQTPEALFITCGDSRVVPNLITQADPGELFLCRNAGNIVPPYGEQLGGVSATIEYAVLALSVRHIIVCGHSNCGAMEAVLHPERVKRMPAVEGWLTHAEIARRIVEDGFPLLSEEGKLNALIRENVLAQLDHLRTHPSVAYALKRRQLEIHGWVYQIHTGAIEAYDAEKEEFLDLASDPTPTAVARSRRSPLAPSPQPYGIEWMNR